MNHISDSCFVRFVCLHIIFLIVAVPLRLVWAAEGDDIELPCDITPPTPGDNVSMVLWFKDSDGIPLYR